MTSGVFKVTARLRIGQAEQPKRESDFPSYFPASVTTTRPTAPVLRKPTDEDIAARETTCRGCPDFWTEQTFCMSKLCRCPSANPYEPWRNLRRCPARRWPPLVDKPPLSNGAAGNVSTPARIAVSGVTLQVALGTRVGNETEYYTQQFTWAASADLANPYWYALFPMNTDAITALIGSSSDAFAWFEVKAIIDGLPTTLLSKQVTISAAVIKEGGLIVPPGLTPLAVETANAMFLSREITGPIVLINPTTGGKIQLSVGDDGTFHADPLT